MLVCLLIFLQNFKSCWVFFFICKACSSSPCKYPATCKDGAHIDSYTCSCTEGYSGTNCDTVAGMLIVTLSNISVNQPFLVVVLIFCSIFFLNYLFRGSKLVGVINVFLLYSAIGFIFIMYLLNYASEPCFFMWQFSS